MIDLLQRLKPNQRRGSKPRCHWITHGNAGEVSDRLTKLITPYGAVSESDRWMPQGFDQTDEAELHKADRLLDQNVRIQLTNWWFDVKRGKLQAPSFDIASTCIIDGRSGLMLVEAKAHYRELRNEEGGKRLIKPLTEGKVCNHERIGKCIAGASIALGQEIGFPFSLSRDRYYQIANRFTWAWKLTELKCPVILVYLGFLNSEDMRKDGVLFSTHDKWRESILAHSQSIFYGGVWNQLWVLNGQPFIPLTRSTEIAYDKPIKGFIIR